MAIIFLIFILCLILILWIFKAKRERSIVSVTDHFMITGGSQGIGLAFAMEAILRGASVTIIARNKDKLHKAKTLLLSKVSNPDQKVLSFSADVSSDQETMQDIVKQSEELLGPVSFLVNCAGTSVCYRFEETPNEELEKMLNINFKGSFYVTQALVPLMKQRQNGRIIFFSSLAGLVGIYGYSAYSASKFAIVGMAQSLKMELNPFGIGVTVSFPPDTDTPGFEKEMESKLVETRAISELGGLFSARDVAIKTLNDALNGHFASSVGLDGKMLCLLCSGSFPVGSLIDLCIQIIILGPMRLIFAKYLYDANRKVKACLSPR